MFVGGEAAAPASTGGNHTDKEGEATGAERDTGRAPSLLAAGFLPSRATRRGPRRPHPSEMRGGLGEVSTNSPKSSQKAGTAVSGCAGVNPGSARPVGTFAPSRQAAPHSSSTESGSRRPGALHPPRGTALPPASHSPLPPLPPAHPAACLPARPVAAASAAASPPPAAGSRPPRGSQHRPAQGRARPQPPRHHHPAAGMVRSPQAGVAGAGRPKGRRNGGRGREVDGRRTRR